MEYAKILLIPLLILLASCGSSHKVVHTATKSTDSSNTSIRDTSRVTRAKQSSDVFSAQDVHIRLEYAADSALQQAKQDSCDTAVWTPIYVPKKPTSKVQDFAMAIKDAISASGSAGRLRSVTIDIGSISDSSGHSSNKDSGGVHALTAADLRKTEVSKSKEVTHTGLPLGLKIGAGLLLLIILAVAAWRLYQKFKP